jgi:hypothetical protein
VVLMARRPSERDEAIAEVTARLKNYSLSPCLDCGGQGYTDMGKSACAVCLGVGVTTPEMLAALEDAARLADAMDGAMADALTISAAHSRISDLEYALTEIKGLRDEMKCDKYKIDRAQLVASNALRGISRAPRPSRQPLPSFFPED